MPAPTIFHIGALAGPAAAPVGTTRLEQAQTLGFSTIMVSLPQLGWAAPDEHLLDQVAQLARLCRTRDLRLLADLDLFSLDISHPLVAAEPALFAVRRSGEGRIVDPRHPEMPQGRALLRADGSIEAVARFWDDAFAVLHKAGISGVRLRHSGALGPALCQTLICGSLRGLWIADATGQDWARMQALKGCGFDYVLGSLPWWDFRESWFVEEHALLSRIAPVMALVESSEGLPPASTRARCARLALAALTGAGLLLPAGFETPADAGEAPDRLAEHIRAATAYVDRTDGARGHLSQRTGPGAPVTILLREGADACDAALINHDPLVATSLGPHLIASLGQYQDLLPMAPFAGDGTALLRPGEVRLCHVRPLPAVRTRQRIDVRKALRAPRVTIANVTPQIEPGLAIKRIVGERVRVEADVYTDGHPVLAADLIHRADDEGEWQHVPMHPLENDRWLAHFSLKRLGGHRFAIEAWIDTYGTFVHDLIKKRDAGLDLGLELEEGRLLIEEACASAHGAAADALHAIRRALHELSPADRVALLIAPETGEAVRRSHVRPHLTRSKPVLIEAERQKARFASWYELFPRSVTSAPSKHGTLRNVIGELPRIQAMGFDVLYLPPIHPIGRTNRKGANNAVTAAPGEPGSPYAIGADEGGHDAIHPELGTFDDFQALMAACRDHGIELALDFAIQCSPDHPWLKDHPGWFNWRPDGSIRYAENPPKKYQDIVNVDFYKPDACPQLWLALRDVVEFWITQGVRIFRVDNPHTKPFPFWRWLIADIRHRYPDVLFLAEAFTRPKIMFELAKLGFSQSYTYFTWRNSKAELTEYMRELANPPVSDWFRPHFFVNTPDINPHFLQSSGRAGFLIRAALAATLSGLWGMYSGFELCEAAALPGREEYLDAEKYEIRPRDYSMPGNIVADIAQLNRIRKAEPALQSHAGLTFYNAYNDNVLYYGKHASGESARILVAVNLDPHRPQETTFEAPLWEWGLGDDQALEAKDLLSGHLNLWRGKMQRLWLGTDRPYVIWRVAPARTA